MSGHFIRRRRRKLERKIAQTVQSHCTAVGGTVYNASTTYRAEVRCNCMQACGIKHIERDIMA